jgi:hypothetical protein
MDAPPKGADLAVKSIRGAIMLIVSAPFLGALYLGVAHILEWLRTGKWPRYSTTNLFSDLEVAYPKVAWRGVQTIIDAVMAAPAAWSLLGLSLVLSFTLGRMVDD